MYCLKQHHLQPDYLQCPRRALQGVVHWRSDKHHQTCDELLEVHKRPALKQTRSDVPHTFHEEDICDIVLYHTNVVNIRIQPKGIQTLGQLVGAKVVVVFL